MWLLLVICWYPSFSPEEPTYRILLLVMCGYSGIESFIDNISERACPIDIMSQWCSSIYAWNFAWEKIVC